MDNLYVALVHYPVTNKRGKVVGSALTTMDLHDIARACKTFGVRGFFVVTPYEDQAVLADQVIRHWTKGVGKELNPHRKMALELITLSESLDEAVKMVETGNRMPAVTVATSARDLEETVTPKELKETPMGQTPHILVFGTAWGLTDEVIEACDLRLAPIKGAGDYNHLSVRSAVSIYLDRLTNG